MSRGGRSPYIRGKKAELELAHILRKRGFLVVRGPASGKASKLFYPDVVAVGRNRVLLFEVKYRRSRSTIYLDARRLWNLYNYAQRVSGEAYIAVRVSDEHRWFIFTLDMVERQFNGETIRYVIPVSKYDDALSINDIIKGIMVKPPLQPRNTSIGEDDLDLDTSGK